MEKENYLLKMVVFMMENLLKGEGMAMVFLQPQMVKNMKENGKITINMETELKISLMAVCMKVNFSLTNLMVMEK